MAGGAINIYYNTILAQSTFNAGNNENSVSIPSGWKTVIIMACRYRWNDDTYVLAQPFPIFIETSFNIQMPALYSNAGAAYVQSINSFARITSDRLYITAHSYASYIVAA